MNDLEDIEHRIRNLPSGDLAKFREWFVEFDHLRWDSQIEVDSKSGKLRGLMSEALADYKAGKAKGI